MSKRHNTSVWVEGLAFPESPRWHDNRLFFVDMYEGLILAASPGEPAVEVLRWPNYVAGLGWLPNGELLFVDMQAQQIMRQRNDGRVIVHCDLSTIANGLCNDMVVDRTGSAYVSSFGFDIQAGEGFRKAPLIFVSADGDCRFCSSDLAFPNGVAVSDNLNTVYVAETAARAVSVFERAADGQLKRPRRVTRLDEGMPDGICLDSEGCLWVAPITIPELLRISPDGNILERVSTSGLPFACMLGGVDGRTLFVATAPPGAPEVNGVEDYYRRKRQGRIELMEVTAARAGYP